MLEAKGMTGGYGGADILHDVEVVVAPAEIVVIIGPNGAGKSTAMKAIFGLVHLREGAVRFDGRDITNLAPNKIVSQGIGFVPQTENVFPSLTVSENLDMGAFVRRDDFEAQRQKVYELFPILRDRRRQPAGQLSGGQRQMVAMGRALMLEPRLLLLDEPTAGLAPAVVNDMFDAIRDVNRELGVSILMVEQNAKQALKMANRGYVLAAGQNRYEDTAANLLANREVAEMFLGG
ncbi:ABC transporter ATP-binding protein [Algihabitans albus]|uniref:ABC transporter ATP-binding protein n=1 Tax=Algihabitans albus TaxID=2164067 RepID=UPI001ABD1A51|nr:ABC transporter ATP-binding protein [Algihabitans albus]